MCACLTYVPCTLTLLHRYFCNHGKKLWEKSRGNHGHGCNANYLLWSLEGYSQGSPLGKLTNSLRNYTCTISFLLPYSVSLASNYNGTCKLVLYTIYTASSTLESWLFVCSVCLSLYHFCTRYSQCHNYIAMIMLDILTTVF